jgi:transcriptional repressor NrdR
VISSREGAGYIRRRRVCSACSQRFTTHEQVTHATLQIVKKDGRREPFDRAKLERGMRLACTKRPVSADAIDAEVASIESALYARGEAEVASTAVGDLVLESLRRLDPVAYIRFASVYRQYPDLAALQQAIGALTPPATAVTGTALAIPGQRYR